MSSKLFASAIRDMTKIRGFSEMVRNNPGKLFERYMRINSWKEKSALVKVENTFVESSPPVGKVGRFDVNAKTRRLNYFRYKLKDASLFDSVVYARSPRTRSHLRGYVEYDFSLEAYIIMWPAHLSLLWLHGVLKKFNIGKNWYLRFQEPRDLMWKCY